MALIKNVSPPVSVEKRKYEKGFGCCTIQTLSDMSKNMHTHTHTQFEVSFTGWLTRLGFTSRIHHHSPVIRETERQRVTNSRLRAAPSSGARRSHVWRELNYNFKHCFHLHALLHPLHLSCSQTPLLPSAQLSPPLPEVQFTPLGPGVATEEAGGSERTRTRLSFDAILMTGL